MFTLNTVETATFADENPTQVSKRGASVSNHGHTDSAIRCTGLYVQHVTPGSLAGLQMCGLRRYASHSPVTNHILPINYPGHISHTTILESCGLHDAEKPPDSSTLTSAALVAPLHCSLNLGE